MKIYLDDVRSIPEGWIGARSFEEFKGVVLDAIEGGEQINAISFDNDLGEGEIEGYEAMKWLGEHHPKCLVGKTEISIHSANPKGRENMEGYLRSVRENKEDFLSMKDRPHPFGEMKRS